MSHRVDDSDLWIDAQHEPEENGCSRDRQVFTQLERDGEQVEDASSSSEEEARHGEGCAEPHAAEEAKRSRSHRLERGGEVERWRDTLNKVNSVTV